MTWDDVVRKLTSRKFWATIAEFVSMLLLALNFEKGSAEKVAALIMAGGAVIAYIVGEGLIDASREKSRVPNIPVELAMDDDKPPELTNEA